MASWFDLFTAMGIEPRLKAYKVYNFKAFEEARVDVKPVTLLVGANSSGKSTLIQALLLLKQTVERVPGPPLYLSGIHEFTSFDTVLWAPEREKGRELGFQLDFKDFSYEFWIKGGIPRVGYRLERALLNGEVLPLKSVRWFLDLSTPSSQQAALTIESFLRERVFYLGPLREEPRTTYSVKGERLNWVGTRGERTVELLATNQKLGERVGQWLVKNGLARRAGRRQGLAVENLRRGTDTYAVYIYDAKTGHKINFNEVGFGFSQLLPILVGCLAVPKGSLVLLEQPEIHLHPKLILKLVKFLTERSKDLNFLIETHSPLMISSLQYLVAEGALAPENVLIYEIERDAKGSRLRKMEIDSEGNLLGEISREFMGEFAEIIRLRYNVLAERRGTN